MFRPFRIQVDIYNPSIETETYKVVLEERTGFIAGSNYGDGDEKIIVTLSPGETKSVVFLAEVYGIPRNSDLARIYVYKDDYLVENLLCNTFKAGLCVNRWHILFTIH